MQIERTSAHAHIRVTSYKRDEDKQWLHRHAMHELLKEYRKNYGAIDTARLVDELASYHVPREVVPSENH